MKRPQQPSKLLFASYIVAVIAIVGTLTAEVLLPVKSAALMLVSAGCLVVIGDCVRRWRQAWRIWQEALPMRQAGLRIRQLADELLGGDADREIFRQPLTVYLLHAANNLVVVRSLNEAHFHYGREVDEADQQVGYGHADRLEIDVNGWPITFREHVRLVLPDRRDEDAVVEIIATSRGDLPTDELLETFRRQLTALPLPKPTRS